MNNVSNLKRSIPFRIAIFLIAAILVLFGIIIFADRIAAFSINNFTEYRLTYDKWGPNPFNRTRMEGLVLEIKEKSFTLIAEEAVFNIDLTRLIKDRQLILKCEMTGVSLGMTGSGEKNSSPEASSQDNPSTIDILAIPFDGKQIYADVSFNLLLDKINFNVTDFKAYSEDIRISGDYMLEVQKDNIEVDIKISFSPKVSAMLDDKIKETILSPDEGGWYSAIINYKGNPVFLRALYSLTVQP